MWECVNRVKEIKQMATALTITACRAKLLKLVKVER